MIITLAGSNRFLLSKRRNELVAKFVEEYSDLALERIDAAEAEPNQILEAVQALPFLASKKMVVARGIGDNKSVADQIEQIISSTASSTELIIYEPQLDKRTTYFKVLKSKTQLEEFNDLDGRQLASWLAGEAKKMNAKLSMADANYLVERLGPNQAIAFSELEKLVLYSPDITRQNIDLLTEKLPQSKIFDLLDAAFAGNRKQALRLYEEQRAQRVEPQAILALLAWQLHLIALTKASKGKSSEAIAGDAKASSYPISKAQNLGARISNDRLAAMISGALEIDYKSKSINVDIDESLKTYIATF